MNSVNLQLCRPQVAQVPLEPYNHFQYFNTATAILKEENGGKNISEAYHSTVNSLLVRSPSGLAGHSSSPSNCPIDVVFDRSDEFECISSNRGNVEVRKVSKSQRTEIGTNVQNCIRQQQEDSCDRHRSSTSSSSVISAVKEDIDVFGDEDKEVDGIDGNIVNIVSLGASIVADRSSKLSCGELNDNDKSGYAISCQTSDNSSCGFLKSLTCSGIANAQFTINNCHLNTAQVEKPYQKLGATLSPAHSETIMNHNDRHNRLSSSTRKKKLNHRPTSTYWQNRSLKLKQCMVSSAPLPPKTSIRCAICRQSVKTCIVFRIRRRPPKQLEKSNQNKTMTTTIMSVCQFCYYEHRSRFGGPTTTATAAAAKKKIHVERVHQLKIGNLNQELRETPEEEGRFMWSSWSWRRHKCPVCQKNFYHPVNKSSGNQLHSVTRRQRDRTPASAPLTGPTDFGAAAANGESVGATSAALVSVNFELEQERRIDKDADLPSCEQIVDTFKMKDKSCKHLKSHRSRGEYLMPSMSFDDCNCCPSTLALRKFPPPYRRSSVPPCNSSSLSLLAAAAFEESTAEITLVPATSPPLTTRPASSSLIVSTTTTTSSAPSSSPRSHNHMHRSTLGLRSSLDTCLSLLPLDTSLGGSSATAGAETAVITLVSKDDAHRPSTSLLNKTSDRRHHHHCRYHRPGGGFFRNTPTLVLNKDGTILHPITHIIPPSSPAGSQIEISRAITNYWGHNKAAAAAAAAAASEEGLLKGPNKDGVISLIASQSSDDSSGGGDTITHVTIMVGQLQPQRALTTEIQPLTY